MKCIYIGDFERSFSSENYITYALEQNGVEVYRLRESNIKSARDFDEVLKTFKPDFVLFCKNRVIMSGNELMAHIKSLGILTVTWVFDLYFDLPPERSNRTIFDSNFRSDIVFSTDGGHEKEWVKQGINHRLLRQGIHAPEACYGEKLTQPTPDILFIGSVVYQDRLRLITSLSEMYGDRFRHIGQGGKHKPVRGMDLNNLLATAKIVVGDSQPSKNYWSNRMYEITGRGGFLLHPKVEGLEKEFEYYKEFIPYDWGDVDQLREIIDYYLVHDDEREKIRRAGFERTKRDYTYTIRCKELISEIAKIKGKL